MNSYSESIKKLNDLSLGDDKEAAHWAAEDILIDYLVHIGSDDLADAFEAARDRVGFCYA